MKSFEDKWYKYMEEKEELYEMKSVFWYKTYDDEINVSFIPFYINHDKTKIKLLTNRKEFDVIRSPMRVLFVRHTPLCDEADSMQEPEETIVYKPNIKKTLNVATDRNGEIFDSATVLEKYYFSDDIKSGVKDWVKTHTRSQEEIVRMARYINKDYKKQEEIQRGN